MSDDLEKFNRTGFTDGYNVLKHLEELKHKPINERKGGGDMSHDDEKDKPIRPEEETFEQEPTAETARSNENNKQEENEK